MVAEVAAVDKENIRALLGTTKGGKKIYLVRKPDCSVRMIAFGSGGELPKGLSGGFSSVQAAQHAVDSYLVGLEDKAKKKKK